MAISFPVAPPRVLSLVRLCWPSGVLDCGAAVGSIVVGPSSAFRFSLSCCVYKHRHDKCPLKEYNKNSSLEFLVFFVPFSGGFLKIADFSSFELKVSFEFCFKNTYKLLEMQLAIELTSNLITKKIYFSIG